MRKREKGRLDKKGQHRIWNFSRWEAVLYNFRRRKVILKHLPGWNGTIAVRNKAKSRGKTEAVDQ